MRTEVGGGPRCPPGAGAADAPGAVSQVLRSWNGPSSVFTGHAELPVLQELQQQAQGHEPRVGLKQEGPSFPGRPPASTPCAPPFQICSFLFLLRRVTAEGVWALRWVGRCGFLAHILLLTRVTATLLTGEGMSKTLVSWSGRGRGPLRCPGQAYAAQEVSPCRHFISTRRAPSLPPRIAQAGCDLRKHP